MATKYKAKDLFLAAKARRYGARYGLRIILEAREFNVPISLGFALIEHESSFRNVFGSDPTIYVGAGEVTRAKYLGYRGLRNQTGKCQGVGPAQLTSSGLQDEADALGGCWIPRWNIRVGTKFVAGLIHQYGLHDGLVHYNGSGPAARQYATDVLAIQAKWHKRLK